jgi:hypothetical protein
MTRFRGPQAWRDTPSRALWPVNAKMACVEKPVGARLCGGYQAQSSRNCQTPNLSETQPARCRHQQGETGGSTSRQRGRCDNDKRGAPYWSLGPQQTSQKQIGLRQVTAVAHDEV